MPGQFFKNLRQPVSSSIHSNSRLKKRAKLKTKFKRNSFLTSATRNAMTIQDIPRNVEEFKPILFHMNHVNKKMKQKNPFTNLYLFKDYLFIVSIDGKIITLYDLPDHCKGLYQKIKDYKDMRARLKSMSQTSG